MSHARVGPLYDRGAGRCEPAGDSSERKRGQPHRAGDHGTATGRRLGDKAEQIGGIHLEPMRVVGLER